MNRAKTLRHEFVAYVPDTLDEGVLYVSMPFATVLHLCCCGCGNEVVTPLDPFDWQMTFDGKSITLAPSIGNWGLLCQSHYWVHRNRVRWARPPATLDIATGRAFTIIRKACQSLRRLLSKRFREND